MKYILNYCLLLSFSFYLSSAKAQEIKIGEKCPDVILKHILNYPTSHARLSDFKSKLIILDFWGLYCSGCIEAFPEMDSLQKEFGDKIRIIMVNKENKDSTQRFFASHPWIKLSNLPFVAGDSILFKFFPHKLVPHHVWLDSNFVVRFITDGYNATRQHIQDFLEGEKIHLAEKKDIDLAQIDLSEPLIATAGHSLLNRVDYYSYLMPGINGLQGSENLRQVHGSTIPNRIWLNRASQLQLYVAAFSEGSKYNFNSRNSVILNVKDTFGFITPADPNLVDEWSVKHSYLYELQVPPAKAGQLYQFMQQDLNRYFGLTTKVEKRKITCLVLVRTGHQDQIKSKGGAFDIKTVKNINNGEVSFVLRNVPFSDFAWQLKDFLGYDYRYPPFIDATGYRGNIDITYNTVYNTSGEKNNSGNPRDRYIAALRKNLQKYGLDLVTRKWLTDVLVISDKK